MLEELNLDEYFRNLRIHDINRTEYIINAKESMVPGTTVRQLLN